MDESQTIEPQHNNISISIRSLTPADAESYRVVRLRALNEQPPAFGSLPEDEPNLAETATRLIESDERCFFGAFSNQQLVGIVRISRYDATNEKHRAYLAGLYILPSFRRNGCGKLLVKKALSWVANKQNIRRINLTVVTEQEAAIRLYQSFGFRIYGTEQETFLKNGRFWNEHLMTLELPLHCDRINRC
ncbi:MAG: GNAT family N-acetyltransferase [Hydrococcus sp. Prado102]|jgi:RimJ/RimL family protein N-acetyltransferase|nr:GNAT family N-acetyltransferase [Hydrococcus sp. Prado102]